MHPPPVPTSRWHLSFRGPIEDVNEYYEQISLWGIDLIDRVAFRTVRNTSLMLLTLDIVGGDADTILKMFEAEKQTWGSVVLRSVREGKRCKPTN